MDRLTFLRVIILNTLFLAPLRFVIVWIAISSYMPILICLMIGVTDLGIKPLNPWRAWAIKKSQYYMTAVHLKMCGMVWVSVQERPDICYKNYLGPDWKPRFDKFGI